MENNMDKNTEHAKKVYDSLCKMLDAKGWHYRRKDDALGITYTVDGDDLPMDFICKFDIERQLIRIFSSLPVTFDESKRMDGAIATCHANDSLVDGSFDYDYSDGTVLYRMTCSFRDSLISDALFNYLVQASYTIVDEYNDKFLMIAKGMMTLEEFMQ